MSDLNRQRLHAEITKQGIKGISQYHFETYDSPNGEFHYKQNITLDDYCLAMTEDYAAEMYRLITTPDTPISECEVCLKFCSEDEMKDHVCVPVERYELRDFMDY